MPYISKAKLEHIKLEAKVEVLELIQLRASENPRIQWWNAADVMNEITLLLQNLDHMKQVLERRARLQGD